MNEVIVSLFLILFGLLSMIFTTGLFIYHTCLIRKNLTTKEELKHSYTEPIGNPFLRNCWRNFKIALCPVISKYSLLDRMKFRLEKNSLRKDRSKIV
jgi:hypothetical protein